MELSSPADAWKSNQNSQVGAIWYENNITGYRLNKLYQLSFSAKLIPAKIQQRVILKRIIHEQIETYIDRLTAGRPYNPYESHHIHISWPYSFSKQSDNSVKNQAIL